MKPSELVIQYRADIQKIARQFAIQNIWIFGSTAKGLDHENSDLDLLIEPTPHTTLFDLAGLKTELEALLGIKVDVLTPRSIPEIHREKIIQEALPL